MTNNSLRLGIAGLGTVGCGVIDVIQRQAALLTARTGKNITIEAVSSRTKDRERPVDISAFRWFDRAEDLAKDPNVDVVLELIGGTEGTAYHVCEQALAHGKHVVTANKALIAHHGVTFAKQAEEKNVALLFEAAVAGGIPVIKALKDGLTANRFGTVLGIMNGTCNYILTQMEKTGENFTDVLDEAQRLGYAEADPTFDVDGIDTAHKLTIIASIAYGVPVNMDALYIEGIRAITPMDIRYAAELGYAIKLLGVCDANDNEVSQKVYPCLVPLTHPIARVDDVYNAVSIEGDTVGRIFLEGKGAGAQPTASAVVADIVDIARGTYYHSFGQATKQLNTSCNYSSIDAHAGQYYVHLLADDKPGVLAEITELLGEEDVSVEHLLQKPGEQAGTAHIIIVTHKTTEHAIKQLIPRLNLLGHIQDTVKYIRIYNQD